MQYLYDNLQIDDVFQMLLNTFFDLRKQIDYLTHTAILSGVGLDNDQLAPYFIDALDASFVPLVMHKISMVVQSIGTVFISNLGSKDLLLRFIGLPELKKRTFLTVREKYKILLSFLNDRKSKEAIAYINNENNECIQYCTKLLDVLTSSVWFTPGLRNAFEPLFGFVPYFLQMAQIYVTFRCDIQDCGSG